MALRVHAVSMEGSHESLSESDFRILEIVRKEGHRYNPNSCGSESHSFPPTGPSISVRQGL